MTKEREWTPTPHSILPHIANMMDRSHTPLLDPCAGDGFALDYLSKKWNCSRYGVEVDPNLFPQVKAIGKAVNERFEDVYARGFSLAYVYPPPDMKNPVAWIRMVNKSMIPGGIIIWRFTKKTLQRVAVIDAFTQLFKDWELFKDPPGTWEHGNHFTIRCRTKDLDKRFTSQGQCFDFSQAVEEAATLGETFVKEWKTPYNRGGIKFRQRGLEWEDVYPDLMDALNEMEMPGTGEKLYFKSVKEWFEDTEDENPHLIPDPSTASASFGQCWTHGHTARDKKLYVLVLVGRKSAIGAVESQLKRGRTVEVGFQRYKLLGGATGAKENFTVLVKTLPHTGALVHIWMHDQCTLRAKGGRGAGSVFVPEDDDTMAAKMLSNALGIPIAPEWMDIASSAAGIQYRSFSNILGRHLGIHKEKVMTKLGEKARSGDLPEPTPILPDKIRPIMPPSIGIWAQLAMQEFINEIPLPGGLIMHAQQIIIKDVDTEEAIDGRIEKTTIERKDAVRITVFHYKGDRAGEWEMFETERMEDDTTKSAANNGSRNSGGTANPSPQPAGHNPGATKQQSSGHTVAARNLAKHLGGP